jgi:YbgC/YbaW family acyl-CoA thioester hydrolase
MISPLECPLFRQSGEIAFGDTDASGWMHFPNVFKYVEAAEHAFLRSLGILVFDRGQGGWPRVKVNCEYKQPFLAGDRYEVVLAISRIGASSLTWDFQILNPAGEVAAFGSLTNVRVDHSGKPEPISDGDRAKLELGIHSARNASQAE